MIKLTESQVKKAVEQYLTYQQNMGKWNFHRLQSGSILTKHGDHFNKINFNEKGTADYEIVQKSEVPGLSRVTYLEIKSTTGKQKPEQIDFQRKAEAQNCRYFIVRDAGQLEGILK